MLFSDVRERLAALGGLGQRVQSGFDQQPDGLCLCLDSMAKAVVLNPFPKPEGH